MVLALGRDAPEGWFLGVLPGFFFGVGEAGPGVDPVVDVALVGDAVGRTVIICLLIDLGYTAEDLEAKLDRSLRTRILADEMRALRSGSRRGLGPSWNQELRAAVQLLDPQRFLILLRA
jgi:hypothetical protein